MRMRMDSEKVKQYAKRPTTTKARQERRQKKLEEVFAIEREQRGGKP